MVIGQKSCRKRRNLWSFLERPDRSGHPQWKQYHRNCSLMQSLRQALPRQLPKSDFIFGHIPLSLATMFRVFKTRDAFAHQKIFDLTSKTSFIWNVQNKACLKCLLNSFGIFFFRGCSKSGCRPQQFRAFQWLALWPRGTTSSQSRTASVSPHKSRA